MLLRHIVNSYIALSTYFYKPNCSTFVSLAASVYLATCSSAFSSASSIAFICNIKSFHQRDLEWPSRKNGKREFVPRDWGLVYVKRDVPGRKVTLPVESTSESDYMWKKNWPLCRSKQHLRTLFLPKLRSLVLWLSRLDWVNPAWRAKVFIRRKVGLRLGGWPYHQKRVTRLDGSLF